MIYFAFVKKKLDKGTPECYSILTEVDEELVEAYSRISPKYARLKTRPWKDFQEYLLLVKQNHQLPISGILLDVGTGNCRNLLLFEEQNWEYLATDFSFELLDNAINLEKNRIYKINNDMKSLSLKHNSVDFAICIASLHHLRNKNDVVKALRNIKNVLRDNEYLIISCWRKWKKGSRKEMIKDLLSYPFKKLKNQSWRHGDTYLSWHGDNKEIIAKRYYHLFSRRELVNIINKSGFEMVNLSKHGGGQGSDNFFVLLKKNNKK